MSKEIERKFLVINDIYKAMAKGRREMAQGYLSRNPDATVRVRVADAVGYITVKGRNAGAVRDEWEYTIPGSRRRGDAETLPGRVGAVENTLFGRFRWPDLGSG